QVNHLVDAGTEKVIGGGAGKHYGKTPRKQPLLDNKPGVPGIGNCPNHQCLCGLRGLFRVEEVLRIRLRLRHEQTDIIVNKYRLRKALYRAPCKLATSNEIRQV